MTLDVALTLGVAAGALALFVWHRLHVEVVGVMVMLALILLGLLDPAEATRGFANEATVTVALMLGISAALARSGVVDLLGGRLRAIAGDGELRLTVLILALVVPVSAVINNTAAVAILLPVVMGLAHSGGTAPSRLLMPLSFGSQLGGTLTLIGTSTNLLVAGIVADMGRHRFGLFEITPAAAILALVGGLYLITVGRWLAPHREGESERLTSRALREYVSELTVEGDSPVLEGGIEESQLVSGGDVELLSVKRDGERLRPDRADLSLQAGDRLLVRGKPTDIARLAEHEHLTLIATASELEADELEEGELKLGTLRGTAARHARRATGEPTPRPTVG